MRGFHCPCGMEPPPSRCLKVGGSQDVANKDNLAIASESG